MAVHGKHGAEGGKRPGHEKMAGKRSNGHVRFKILAVVAAVSLVFGAAIGTTSAWLIAKSDPVVNTFTYGDINLTLTETDTGDGDGDAATNRYEMLPDVDIAKDPKVTVKADSVDCWLFVKLDPSANLSDYITYGIADGWSVLQGGVYYREVAESDSDQVFDVLKDNKVHVRETVTKEDLNNLDAGSAGSVYPKLSITAHAVQKAGFENAGAAWVQANAT